VLDAWMRAGVTVVDPATTWVDVGVELSPDVTIRPGTQLHGTTRVAGGATVGPDTTLVDCEVGPGADVVRTHGTGAVIGAGATVGPFSFLRPEAHLHPKAKAGAFVEIKNSEVGEGSKVPHLSYIGDTDIGPGTNIGAGNITANYDGKDKHRTTIGANVRTSVHTAYVAPVTVADEAYTAAGTVVTDDVPEGALAISRGRQKNIEGYAARKQG
jgi:bifunctional UDP-N-acetylglucosamine pyrophosphorylase / glucosamine-1-phosphate N-acetyltransferase